MVSPILYKMFLISYTHIYVEDAKKDNTSKPVEEIIPMQLKSICLSNFESLAIYLFAQDQALVYFSAS